MLVITGGAGFIGSNLLASLNSRGKDDIIVVDDLGTGSKWKNLAGKQYADFMHKNEFIRLLRANRLPWQVEAIVHLGASSSTTEQDANYLMENNFHYSRDICLYAAEKNIRVINASSAATYGAGENGFGNEIENLDKLRPLNMYGYSKHLLDLWLKRENLLGQVASLKFFNVYGPNEYHKGAMQSVAAKFFGQAKERGMVSLFASNTPEIGDGEQKRDFIYVKDCCELMVWLLGEGRHVSGILNVGTGQAETFRNVACSVFQAMNMPPEIRFVPMPENVSAQYQNYTCADMKWLDEKNCPVKFRSAHDGIMQYVREYLAKTQQYI